MSNNSTQLTSKYKLALSMKELMKNHTIDKITVKDITDNCNLTRQTFYRNFEDKYALVNWYFEILVQNSFIEINEKNTLYSALEQKFTFIQEELIFFKTAFKSQSQNSLIEYDYKYIYNFYKSIISNKTDKPLSDEIEFSLKFYCRASIYATVDWVTKETRPTPSEMANFLICALPLNLKDTLLNFK